MRCLNDANEVACNSGLKKSIADGISAVGVGLWRGKEACEEGTRLSSASFFYIYNLESAIMICKVRHLGVSYYFQLRIRVLPVSLVTIQTLNYLCHPTSR